jgi:hypothetical protein
MLELRFQKGFDEVCERAIFGSRRMASLIQQALLDTKGNWLLHQPSAVGTYCMYAAIRGDVFWFHARRSETTPLDPTARLAQQMHLAGSALIGAAN